MRARGSVCVVALLAACGPGAVGPVAPEIPPPAEHSGARVDVGVCFDPTAPVGALALNRWRHVAQDIEPDPKPTPVADPEPTIEGGELDAAMIRRVFREAEWSLSYCYEVALADDPSLEGRVVVELTIESDGTVSQSLATGLGPLLDGCVGGVVRTLVFPREPGGVVRVTYPIDMNAAMRSGAPLAPAATFDRALVHPHAQAAATECLAAAPGAGVATIDVTFADGAVVTVDVDGAPDDAAACVDAALAPVAIETANGTARCRAAYGWESMGAATPVIDVGIAVTFDGREVGAGPFEAAPYAPLSAALSARREQAGDGSLFIVRAGRGATFGSVWRAAHTARDAGYTALRLERMTEDGPALIYAARAPLVDVSDEPGPLSSILSVRIAGDELYVGASGVEVRYMVTDLDGAEAPNLLGDALDALHAESGAPPLVVVEVASDPDAPFERVERIIRMIASFDRIDLYLVLPDALTTRFELVESSR